MTPWTPDAILEVRKFEFGETWLGPKSAMRLMISSEILIHIQHFLQKSYYEDLFKNHHRKLWNWYGEFCTMSSYGAVLLKCPGLGWVRLLITHIHWVFFSITSGQISIEIILDAWEQSLDVNFRPQCWRAQCISILILPIFSKFFDWTRWITAPQRCARIVAQRQSVGLGSERSRFRNSLLSSRFSLGGPVRRECSLGRVLISVRT